MITPVAFIIFNRAETVVRVFEAIRRARPARLFVIADGPRPGRPDDIAKCAAARAVVERIDWDCQVTRIYSETNLGCGRRIVTGLDQVFSEVEQAIILEDDCLPAPSFFPFCEQLLEFYRHEEKVWLISGNNYQGGRRKSEDSYYFSKYSHTWGWATWRRTWRLYDFEMKTWPDYKRSGRLATVCERPDERRYWTRIFDRTCGGLDDIWDYQMLYACWFHERLVLLPQSNLISNIGFGANGTHVMLEDDLLSHQPVTDIWEIRHPARIEADREADRHTFETIHQGRWRRVRKHLTRGFRERGPAGLAGAGWEIVRMLLRLLRGM